MPVSIDISTMLAAEASTYCRALRGSAKEIDFSASDNLPRTFRPSFNASEDKQKAFSVVGRATK
jgi:hypothetical protein